LTRGYLARFRRRKDLFNKALQKYLLAQPLLRPLNQAKRH